MGRRTRQEGMVGGSPAGSKVLPWPEPPKYVGWGHMKAIVQQDLELQGKAIYNRQISETHGNFGEALTSEITPGNGWE
jgi:hypothetical protein